mgnify:CR=1 FL=1
MGSIGSTKLIQLISTFSKKEMNHFIEMVDSSYFNKNKALVKLANAINIEFESIHKLDKSFLESKTGSINLNKDMSALLKLADEFIVLLAIKKDKSRKELIRLSELNRRGVTRLFQSGVKSYKEKSAASKLKNSDVLLNDFLIEEECDKAFDKDNQAPFNQSLQIKGQTLDAFYVLTKLKMYCEMMMRERLNNQTFEKTFYVEVQTFIEKQEEQFKAYPSIHTYLELAELLRDDVDECKYQSFYNSTTANIKSFPKEEAANFVQHAINHCIRRTNSGFDYIERLFEAMRFQVENDFLVIDGTVHDRSYKNIIEVAIRSNETEWALQFLDNHIQYIKSDQTDMIYNYNLANILLTRGDYKAVLRHLTFVNFKDVFYQLSCKALLIKTFYELNDFLTVESSIVNFKSFIKREKSLPHIQRDMYLNFCGIILELMKIGDKQKHTSQETLTIETRAVNDRISQYKYLADKYWLKTICGDLTNP